MMLLGTKSFTNWEPEPFFETGQNPTIVSEPGTVFDWNFGVQYIGEGPEKGHESASGGERSTGY